VAMAAMGVVSGFMLCIICRSIKKGP